MDCRDQTYFLYPSSAYTVRRWGRSGSGPASRGRETAQIGDRSAPAALHQSWRPVALSRVNRPFQANWSYSPERNGSRLLWIGSFRGRGQVPRPCSFTARVAAAPTAARHFHAGIREIPAQFGCGPRSLVRRLGKACDPKRPADAHSPRQTLGSRQRAGGLVYRRVVSSGFAAPQFIAL